MTAWLGLNMTAGLGTLHEADPHGTMLYCELLQSRPDSKPNTLSAGTIISE